MEYPKTCQPDILKENGEDTVRSSQKTLKSTLNELIQCQKEISELNKKLFSLCKSDKELQWLKSKGPFYLPED
ncbi:MAG: hypothetical protein VW455_13295 [Nitrospinota bacterium]